MRWNKIDMLLNCNEISLQFKMGADIHIIVQVFDNKTNRYRYIYVQKGVVKLSDDLPNFLNPELQNEEL